MIDLKEISSECSLLNDKLCQDIEGIIQKLQKPVTIKAVLDMEQEKSVEMASFLKRFCEIPAGAPVNLELYSVKELSEGPDAGALAGSLKLNTQYLPVTGLYADGEFSGVSFHGIPGGKEINAFILAVYNLAGPGQELSEGTKKRIQKLKRPVNVKICVSLGCHHCSGLVTACQRIAMLNPLIDAEMIDANLYSELVEQYQISRVPFMIVNDKDTYTGPRSIEDLVVLFKNSR
ncbi:MAG: thioredoxin family protein [Lachnospiraceae bacterium]|nr:thioredoxin family protein [Lachnospiraceae bacterium]